MAHVEPAELETLADLIVGKLSGPVVSSVVPAWVPEMIRADTKARPWSYRYVLPIGAGGFMAEWSADPDGTLRLVLSAISGEIFWRGSFRGT